ncbi:MAG TPA: DUF3099 domain-containing protein [Trebonia sp.]|nr:DUF3099 domain-containing protein [Trebonia sp.]
MHSAEGRSGDGDEREQPRPPAADPHVHDDDVYGITTAETSHVEEITKRQKQYILTMMIRVVSIIVVVVVPGLSWQLKVGLCLVATIIPYIAVVRANGGPVRDTDPTNLMVGRPKQGELPPSRFELPTTGERADFIVGETVFRDDADRARPGAGSGTAEPPPSGAAPADAGPEDASQTAAGPAAGARSGESASTDIPAPAKAAHEPRSTAAGADQSSDQRLTAH